MGRRSIVRRELLPSIPGGLPSGSGALGNWVFTSGTPASQTQTNSAPTGVPVIAAAIQLKYSGTVRVNCNAQFNSGTTAKTISHVLMVRQFTNVTALPRFTPGGGGATIQSNNVALGHDVAGSTAQQNPLNWGVNLTSDAAGLPANSIDFAGVPISTAGLLRFGQSNVATLTGLLTAQGAGQWPFYYSGMVPNLFNNIPDQHWPIGGDTNSFLVVALMLLSTNGGDLVSYDPCSITLQEQPLP